MLLPAVLALALCAPTTLHVAPDGQDTSPGTATAPFATLARAQQAARGVIAAGLDGPLTVDVTEGRYELAEPWVLAAADGGTAQFPVTWRAVAAQPSAQRQPVVTLSGGRRVTGWKRGGDGVWTAQVKPGTHFRQLAVNGRLAPRASFPDTGWLRLKGADLADDRSRYTLTFAPADLQGVPHTAGLEVVVCGNWEISRKAVASIDFTTGVVTLAPPHAGCHGAIRPGPGRPARFENARAFVNQPGEWSLDEATGVVSLLPAAGTDPNQADIVAPHLTRLLELRGTPTAPLRNLHLVGFEFADADWDFPPQGYAGAQAGFHCYPKAGQKGWEWSAWHATEAAVVGDWLQGCSLQGGGVVACGGVGLRLRSGVQGCTVEGLHIRQIGSNGVMVGEDDWTPTTPAAAVPRENQVIDCLVEHTGQFDWGGVGIWASFCDRLTIAHNEVRHTPYSGISIGWRWDPTPTGAKGNVIAANHVWDTMNKLCDGGCLYTLGLQPGSRIEGNLFHDAHRSEFAQGAPNNGIFMDEGSTGWHLAGNLIYGTSAEPIRFNQSGHDRQTWGENILNAPLATAGKRGPGLLCDGSTSFVEVPHRADLDAPALTAECWFRVEGPCSGEDNRRWLVNKNGNEWQESHWGLVTTGSAVGAYLNIGGGQANMVELWSAKGIVAPQAWQHAALTYDGQVLRVYLNGRQVAEQAVNRPRRPGGTPLVIGRRQDGYIAFQGALDEVSVYPRALTAAQVAERFAAGGQPPAPELAPAGTWSFEQLTDALARLRQYADQTGPRGVWRRAESARQP